MLRRLLIISLFLAFTSAASAQDDDGGSAGLGAPAEDSPAEDSGADYGGEDDEVPPGPAPLLSDEQADVEEAEQENDDGIAEGPVDEMSPRELENTDYFFLGAFGRGVFIPGAIQRLFVVGGIDALNAGAGLEFTYRRNNFNVIAQAWWNGAQGSGPFRAEGDPDTEIEWIDVDLGLIFVNASFMWSFPLDSDGIIAFELGFDLGIGFIYGDLRRTEATPDGDSYRACNGPGDPTATPGYCETSVAPPPCYANEGGHYDCIEEDWTSEGGDTPLIFPWVSLPHVALRIKPIRQLQIRIDAGYGLYNIFFGGSVAYGF